MRLFARPGEQAHRAMPSQTNAARSIMIVDMALRFGILVLSLNHAHAPNLAIPALSLSRFQRKEQIAPPPPLTTTRCIPMPQLGRRL